MGRNDARNPADPPPESREVACAGFGRLRPRESTILAPRRQEPSRLRAELRDLAGEMLEAMYARAASARRAAGRRRAEAARAEPARRRASDAGERVLCNPKITQKKGRPKRAACPFPDIQAEVERWVQITVTYQDLDGKEADAADRDGWRASSSTRWTTSKACCSRRPPDRDDKLRVQAPAAGARSGTYRASPAP
jgi:peptide deformylase